MILGAPVRARVRPEPGAICGSGARMGTWGGRPGVGCPSRRLGRYVGIRRRRSESVSCRGLAGHGGVFFPFLFPPFSSFFFSPSFFFLPDAPPRNVSVWPAVTSRASWVVQPLQSPPSPLGLAFAQDHASVLRWTDSPARVRHASGCERTETLKRNFNAHCPKPRTETDAGRRK
ncbi:hypothetical protein LX32DRAFT_120679 [Colletotrichum zoysiae]|uniref:Uncharacterized protein n=1 Tax=Colletotrichum zoysiae TaxID=1216348 RepID=A0AAD9H9E6_9PEZI|nr:hypothetical protein LX32DRAFT_120679 [Colletotrichum zoysiae]